MAGLIPPDIDSQFITVLAAQSKIIEVDEPALLTKDSKNKIQKI
jgi:hypothetical protein